MAHPLASVNVPHKLQRRLARLIACPPPRLTGRQPEGACRKNAGGAAGVLAGFATVRRRRAAASWDRRSSLVLVMITGYNRPSAKRFRPSATDLSRILLGLILFGPETKYACQFGKSLALRCPGKVPLVRDPPGSPRREAPRPRVSPNPADRAAIRIRTRTGISRS